MKTAAIIQSSYLPWKGYFDIIQNVDVFVFLDDVQMTKRDWRSRNKIKTPRGTDWLTIPVMGGRHQLIYQTKIAQGDWQNKHLKTLQSNYGKAPFFKDYGFLLDWLYLESHTFLSEFNQKTIKIICEILGLETLIINSVDLETDGSKDDKLINICKNIGATGYLSGPSARNYIDEEKFMKAGIKLAFKDYFGYPEYPQLFPPYDHMVSVLDLLFNCGSEAPFYIWGWRKKLKE